MARIARWLLAPCTALTLATAAGAQTTLYEHTSGGPGLWASDQGNDGSGFRVFDQGPIEFHTRGGYHPRDCLGKVMHHVDRVRRPG